MKKIKVIVKEKTILELAEDGLKGDQIDLKDLVEVDTSYLESVIDSGKDKVYQTKLEDVKRMLIAENNVKLTKLNSDIETLKKENESNLKIRSAEIEKQYADRINELNNNIELLKKENDSALKQKESNVRKECDAIINVLKNEIEILKSTKKGEIDTINSKNLAEINKIKADDLQKFKNLEQQYNLIMSQYENQIKNTKLERDNEWNKKLVDLEKKYQLELANMAAKMEKMELINESEKEKALTLQKNKFDEELKTKEYMINNLQRAKASMNVKQTGEDLESWCNNEVSSYMQNGLLNCTWEKDNKVVREEDEAKGSKADYIFKVYADKKHLDNELLASVCLDMKDENPDSVNKKTNSDYYKALDKNREKKNCKYAVLVSNLEMDKPNVLPIFKVREYDNMYVVRPAYLMTFLNMITSLTTRFADIILSKEAQQLDLKNKLDLMEEFEDIKKTYLDKPLESLEKNIEAIIKSSDAIKTACKNIDDQCDKINKSYISQINEKINKYELKLNKIGKQLD